MDIQPQATTSDGADPIVEKACSNFMYKLMEFQRQHKPYASQTLSYTRPTYEPQATIPTNSPISPSTSTSNLYNPIVSARKSTFGEYASQLSEPTTATVLDSPAAVPNTPYR